MEELEGDEMMTAAYPDTPVAGVTGDFIRHARNGGEVRLVGRHLVDSYDRSTNTVYEFHGCLWHGCTSCFPNRAAKSKLNPDRTFAEVRETARAKEDQLRAASHTLRVIWECEWDKLVKEDAGLETFLSNSLFRASTQPT